MSLKNSLLTLTLMGALALPGIADNGGYTTKDGRKFLNLTVYFKGAISAREIDGWKANFTRANEILYRSTLGQIQADDLDAPLTTVHEFGHYVFGLFDEYSGTQFAGRNDGVYEEVGVAETTGDFAGVMTYNADGVKTNLSIREFRTAAQRKAKMAPQS